MALPAYRDNNPFIALNTEVYQTGETYVTWKLDPDFDDPGPYSFYLEVSNTDNPENDEDYERINADSPVSDQNGYILDDKIRRYSFDNKAIYRVAIETPIGAYSSDPEKPNGTLPKHLLKVYREILRKERLQLNPRMGGTAGTLFKRKTYGTKAPDNEEVPGAIDKNTGQVIDYNTKEYFGTEYLGGYFAGADYPLLYMNPESNTSSISNIGTQEPHQIQARGLTYPIPSSKDVWYEQDTGRAFYINKVVIASKFSAKPLSVIIDMTMASPLDIVYDFIEFQSDNST